jgi:hypothetical protein
LVWVHGYVENLGEITLRQKKELTGPSNPRKMKFSTLLLRLYNADIVISMLLPCTAMKLKLEKESRHREFLVKRSL